MKFEPMKFEDALLAMRAFFEHELGFKIEDAAILKAFDDQRWPGLSHIAHSIRHGILEQRRTEQKAKRPKLEIVRQ